MNNVLQQAMRLWMRRDEIEMKDGEHCTLNCF